MQKFKQIMAIILALITIMGTTTFAPVMTTVSATAITQNQAVSWIKSKAGGAGIDRDGNGYWCVDMVYAYYEYLGFSRMGGNASAYAWNSLPSDNWQRISYYSGFVAQPGDIAVWSWTSAGGDAGHVALVTSATSYNMTVVDQNGYDYSTNTYHAYPNYSTISYSQSGMSFYGVIRPKFASQNIFNYTNISEGNYYIQNKKTGAFIIYQNAVDANEQNVVLTPFGHHNAQKMYITTASTGYKIQPNGTARLLTPVQTGQSESNVNIFNNINSEKQWWRFQKVDGGYIIHNVQNENCVLDATEYGNVVITNYQKGKQSQIWIIEKTSILPEKPLYTYRIENNKIVVEFTNYKDTEVHEVVVANSSGKNIYSQYNISGRTHTTTTLSDGTYTLKVVAVSKKIGVYQVGESSTVIIENQICNHLNTSLIIDTEPTCTAEGKGHKDCTVCGARVQSNISIAKKNHSAGNWYTTVEPTLTKEGKQQQNCTVCGTVLATRKLEKLQGEDSSKVFIDIKKSDWFYESVKFAYNNNLFSGTSPNIFSPHQKMNRAMFVTVLGRLHGVQVNHNIKTQFSDVKTGQYYTGYVKWANENGIVAGLTSNSFGPNANITREQICTMLVRYCNKYNITLKKVNAPVTFKDAKQISSYAKSAVKACQEGGLVNGEVVSGGYQFRPNGNATRAEVATIIMNFANNYK